MKFSRILLALALAFLPLADAAAGSGTITTKDAGGVTRTFVVTTDGSGNFVGQAVLCDQSAAANCATVSGNALSVSVTNANTNGQATMANSSPVVIASNQTANALWGHGATGAAAPSGATYTSVLSGGATGGLARGNIACDSHVFKHITSATDTLAVQGVASQTIYVCGWRSRAAGVATWYLENTASANANCSSTLTQITGVATEAANTGEVAKSAFWDGLKNTAGNGLCINSTGTGGVDIDVWYAQF